MDLKSEYMNHLNWRSRIEETTLEEKITHVIFQLADLPLHFQPDDANLNVMMIQKKIWPQNVMLLRRLSRDALQYYRFIEKILHEQNTFELIAHDVKSSYEKLQKIYPTQQEIVFHLSEWILKKTHLTREHAEACDIIVAFFIQNCEVFYEIT